jgi:predicted  nucleic acid-binding Zn-ribbon protein
MAYPRPPRHQRSWRSIDHFFVGQQRSDRKAQFEAMHERLTHLDDCIDTVQKLVIGKAVTREELVAMKAEINETFTRMRAAVSQEANSLHQRIMRLESPHFAKGWRMLGFGIRGILREINDNLKHIRQSQTRMENKMSQMDDEITQLKQDVAAERTAVDSAKAMIEGFAAQLQMAVNEARQAGATQEQLQGLQDLHAAVTEQTSDLAQAVANQSPPATGGTSGGSTGGTDTVPVVALRP